MYYYVLMTRCRRCVYFFFFQAEDGIRDYKVTGVQTCALLIWHHDPIPDRRVRGPYPRRPRRYPRPRDRALTDDEHERDRKSTRLNSSHLVISYAVFCLKKKMAIRYKT